ncbi:MAG: hypothetical protein IPK03_03395 [Bacteroidetes bacterium]|nr:hypothetical protein [Bacteroidota bacterium]
MLSLNNFNSFYEIIVGFSGAYTSVKSISAFFNEASLRKYTRDKSFIDEKKKFSDQFFSVTKESRLINRDYKLKQELADFETQLEIAEEHINHIEYIATGEMFKSVFTLTGSFYLCMVILTCFSGVFNDNLLILIASNICLIYTLYFVYMFIKVKYYTKNINSNSFNKHNIGNTSTNFLLTGRNKFGKIIFTILSSVSIIFMFSFLFYFFCRILHNYYPDCCIMLNVIFCVLLFILLIVFEYFKGKSGSKLVKSPFYRNYLKTFIIFSLVVCIFSSIEYYCFNFKNAIGNTDLTICKFISIPKGQFIKSLLMFCILNFATLPFIMYFFRGYLLIEGIAEKLKYVLNDIDDKFKLYNEFIRKNKRSII